MPHKCFKRKIWLYNRGDYDEYRRLLSNIDWNDICSTDDVDLITANSASCITNAAAATIPNRIVTIRKYDPKWMTNEIRKLIRQKRRVHSKAKRFNRETDWIQFRNIRNKVISTIRKARDDYQTNLVNKLKDTNPSHKSWWKLCGQISGIKQTTRGIPPLLKKRHAYL